MKAGRIPTIAATLTLMLFMVAGAHAHLVHIDSYIAGDMTDPLSEAAWIEATLGLDPGILTYLNKRDFDEGWDNGGAVPDSFFDVFFDIDEEEDEAYSGEVSWNLAGTGYELSYMLIKSDGVYYNLYSVSDGQVITSGGLEYFDNDLWGPPAISHVSFYGRRGVSVPDGGATIALLALGVLGVGALKRRMSD